MIDIGLLIVFSGFSIAAVAISAAHAYKIFTEIKIKKKAFDMSIRETKVSDPDPDELSKKLEELRRARFAPPVHSYKRNTPK